MIVIADSTPLHYLILIHQAGLLPRLFDRVLIPPAVFDELQHDDTPDVVGRWMAAPPSWLQVHGLHATPDPALNYLDAGERDAIALAEELRADQLLLDDADGVGNRPLVGVPCDSALDSRRRAIGLLPSLGLLENGPRRRAARSGRVLPSGSARPPRSSPSSTACCCG